LFVCLFGV